MWKRRAGDPRSFGIELSTPYVESLVMKLLVTGGLGFIGSTFIKYMLSGNDGIEVTNLDNLSIGSNPVNLKDLEVDERYKFLKGDIADYELVARLVKESDAVINIAAETHVDRSISNPNAFLDSNTMGTFVLLEAVRKNNPEAIYAQVSTDEIYGDIINGSFKEDDGLRPSSPYAASKAAADMFVLAYHRTYGLRTVITRCTNNFGPFQFPEKLIPKTIIRASMNLKIPVYGSGRHIRDWIYVSDHCEALDLVLRKGEPGEVYNIAGGNEVENIKLVQTILDIMGKPHDLIEFVEDRPGHDIRYSLDCSKIKKELGWEPKHSLEEAIKETVNWYLKNEQWWRPLADKRVLHPTPWKLRW